MKNFYTFNLLLAALLAIAAFATYEPALKTSGSCGICAGFYEFQDAGDTAVPLASPANTGTARPGDSTASGPDEANAAVLTSAFQYRIGSVRLFGRWIAIERDSVSEAEALVYSKVNAPSFL